MPLGSVHVGRAQSVTLALMSTPTNDCCLVLNSPYDQGLRQPVGKRPSAHSPTFQIDEIITEPYKISVSVNSKFSSLSG